MLPETTKKRLFTFSIYVWVINILTLMPQYEDLGYLSPILTAISVEHKTLMNTKFFTFESRNYNIV